MSRYLFTPSSRNPKTGPIPVVTSSRDTCPADCPLMGKGCYAELGPISWVWDSTTESGVSFTTLIQNIKNLPRGTLWRYGQAGDLPNDEAEVITLAKASSHTKSIVYTHKRDFELYRTLSKHGMHVNLSASTIEEADELSKTGLPVVVVLPSDQGKYKDETLREYRDRIGGMLRFTTPGGNRVAICPATYLKTDCAHCQACSKPRVGGTIIGFPAHGSRKKNIDQQFSSRSYVWRNVKSLRSSQMSVRI